MKKIKDILRLKFITNISYRQISRAWYNSIHSIWRRANMGIGSNLMVELEEQRIEKENFQNIIYEAAHYVLNEKMTRDEAYKTAK